MNLNHVAHAATNWTTINYWIMSVFGVLGTVYGVVMHLVHRRDVAHRGNMETIKAKIGDEFEKMKKELVSCRFNMDLHWKIDDLKMRCQNIFERIEKSTQSIDEKILTKKNIEELQSSVKAMEDSLSKALLIGLSNTKPPCASGDKGVCKKKASTNPPK